MREVLVRGKVSADGRSVVIAPGVEVALPVVRVMADVPPQPEVMVLVMGFPDQGERDQFCEEFEEWIRPAAA